MTKEEKEKIIEMLEEEKLSFFDGDIVDRNVIKIVDRIIDFASNFAINVKLSEKEIPVKPEGCEYEYGWSCPRCQKIIISCETINYCPYCGQKIDWSGIDEKG